MRVAEKFDFKQFTVYHDRCTMKVGTDGVLLGAWTKVESAKRILDVGTGSGVMALILAQRSSAQAMIDAIDIAKEECEQARENIARSPWPAKVQIHNQSFQKFKAEPYDLIVSNPPYFNNSYKPPKATRLVARHTQTLTHQDLLTHNKRLLKPSGRLNLILPATEGSQMKLMAEREGWFNTRECSFRSRNNKPIERLLLEFQLVKGKLNKEELVLYKAEQEWSPEYYTLTKEFYL
ncbi:MAG: methyltransferase [Cyclobacteriaceae bacterium]|jgi:tRNA1Val (adenine37-N6)-methyltransferase|nr:methyltransferase [Cyclobacteriaceae bacterium]